MPTLYPTKCPGFSIVLHPLVSFIRGGSFFGDLPSPRVPPPGLRDLLGSWGSQGRVLEPLGFRSRDARAQDTCLGRRQRLGGGLQHL